MKTLKKILTAVLTAALLLAIALPAFATEPPTNTGSITVMEPGEHAYTAYKIFDVTDDGSGELTYTAADPWKTAIEDALEAGELTGLEIADDGTVTKLPYFKAADFAAWAKDNIPSGADSIALSEVDGKMTTGPVEPGYYLVVPDQGDTASLCTVLDTEIAIQNKNDMPFDKKAENDDGEWVDETGVQIGDTINFKITAKVPVLDADQESYFYLISDRMTEGLTLNETVTVTINGVEVDMTVVTNPNEELFGDQIRFVYDDNGRCCGFDMSLDMLERGKDASIAGTEIVITYSGVVNENAAGEIQENFATLDYGDENEQHHKESMTKHYTSTIVIDKYETGSPETKVPGAKFVLKNAEGKYYAKDDDGNVSWVDDEDDAYVAVTDEEGGAEFPGLKDGTYYLKEIEAPAGYTELTEEIEVIVDGSASTAVGLDPSQIYLALTEIVRVANTPGTLLPSTGGIGTYIFYIVGGVLIVAAAAVIVISGSARKRSNN